MNPHPTHYPQPPAYGMPPQPPKASGLAIASMVLGIIGCGVTGVAAVVLGHIAMGNIKRSGGTLTGGGMAIAGLILGYLQVAAIIGFCALAAVGAYQAKRDLLASSKPWEMKAIQVRQFPPLPAMRPLGTTGAKVGQVRLRDGSGPAATMAMRLYLPAGDHPKGSLPCVLVAPAGTNLLTGADLDEEGPAAYHDECLPYAEKGIAVVLYSLDGEAPEDEASTEEATKAYEAFRAAKAGLANAKNALEFVLARMPEVDATRIYAAGHSSAGTLALLFAAHEPGLAGCIAYAPVPDVEAMHREVVTNPFSELVFPGVKLFIRQSSPMTHAGRFTKPILLFHASDDTRVSGEDIAKFTNAVKARGGSVRLEQVPTGEHYESMIDQGIPAGIRFIDP
jgi:dipeptidyl aminopeptidase/acylaminoacyl peptidase